MSGTSCTAAELVEGHVRLEVESLDRIYLNGYVPNLQVSGQVVSFLVAHRGNPIPSPALLGPIGNRFRKAVAAFAAERDIPVIRFAKTDRKLDVVRPLLAEAERDGRAGPVAVGVAQEFQNVFAASTSKSPSGLVQCSFYKSDRRVTCFYFYLFDDDFGPCFIKICTYFPYPIKVWCNGHEWAKRQAAKAGIGFTALANGFASCDDPAALQAICDRLGPGDINTMFHRWMRALPTPLDDADRAAGYWWELSMRQIEVSRTLVFDAPRHVRAFADALVRDNLGVGRPDEVKLIFTGKVERRGRPPKRPPVHSTRVVTRGVDVTVNVAYKRSRIKQYLKEGRAWRIECVINSPDDLRIGRRLVNLPELVARCRDANRRILDVQHAGQGCAIGPTLFERLQQPYVREGQRTGALRFGDQRVMALAGALCVTLHAVAGFTNRSLRALVAGQLGSDYTARQMTYDLRRLRLHGLIRRIHGTNRYTLTADGLAFAVFYTKFGQRVIGPTFDLDRPNAPPQLLRALGIIDRCIDDTLTDAGLAMAA